MAAEAVRQVTVTYLELRPEDPQNLHAGLPDGFALRKMAIPQPEVNRFLYATVGADWFWTDRLETPIAAWARRVGSPGFETWLLQEEGSIAGYFELEPDGGDALELAYFGLMPAYAGRGGLGGPLLSAAVRRAWERGARRLTVNTCTLDHPAALANYRARGFRVLRAETRERTLPDAP